MKRMICMLLLFLMLCPAMAETVQDQALQLIQQAGIEADAVLRVDSEIIVTLVSGGTASLYTCGDFDIYDLSWQFSGAADTDVALYLDHALTLLAALEAKIPADISGLSAWAQRQAESYAALVEKNLLSLENLGQQGLDILLLQLSQHDDSALNPLRARLAARMLGERGYSPVDPVEGCAWYDALVMDAE